MQTCPKCRGRSYNPEGQLCWHCEDRANEPRVPPNERLFLETIPARFMWATFDADDLDKRVIGGRATIEKAVEYVAQRSSVVLLAGKAGTGKTSLACAMLRAWQQATRRRVRFVAASELAKARMQHSLGEGEAPLVEQCERADLLLIDDLGAEPTSPPRAEIADVIQRRHNYNQPIWFTTGLASSELTARYGGGLSRRITEDAKLIRLERS